MKIHVIYKICLELQLIKENTCLIGVQDGGRLGNSLYFCGTVLILDFKVSETMKQKFTHIQLEFR